MRHILYIQLKLHLSFPFFFFFGGCVLGGGGRGEGERECGSDQNKSNKWNLLQGKKRFHLLTTVKTKLLKYCFGRKVRH